MKKFLVLFIASSISLGALAQMGKVMSAQNFMDQGLLDKAKAVLDEALVNEKSKDNPKTYVALGRLCQEVFKSENPKYKALVANPLEDAYNAYQKAAELDPKGGTAKQYKINSTYLKLGNDFVNQAIKKFELKDYEGALASFEYDIKIASSDMYVGAVDTGIYFNAGLAAYNSKLWDKAIPYFEKCIEMKYEAIQPHLLIYQSYLEKGDSAKAEGVLKNALDQYPGNKDVILWLLDYYYKSNKAPEAFAYLETAKAKDPNNFSLYLVEGSLFMKQDKWDDAIKALNKSLELKPDFFDILYNLGVCYYNKAVEVFKQANEIMDATKYNVAVANANEIFIQAIPYFERASSVKPDDVDAMRNLKELYFRLRTVKPEYETKYNEIMKKLEAK
jgi:tetratricopeptide (TPR) repeat protein